MSGESLRWLSGTEPANPRPQSHDHHRGGLERNDVNISEETPGARQHVFESTLFIHAGLTGRIDIQVAPHTMVTAMLAYVATMIGVKQDDVDIQHSRCGSIGNFGPLVQDIPGIGEFDTLVVHRTLTVQVTVIFHTEDQGTSTVATTLDTFGMEARTDVRGTYIWTHILHRPQKIPQGNFMPHSLEMTSPSDCVFTESRTLRHSAEWFATDTNIDIKAHIGDSVDTHCHIDTAITLRARRAQAARDRQEGLQNNEDEDLISPTQPWQPENISTSPPQPQSPPARLNRRGGAVGSAEGWVYFVDSITQPSADYATALAMARRTTVGTDDPAIETTRTNIGSSGWDALTNWSNLRQVLMALDYGITNESPWKKLGIPHLERPLPSKSYLDLRLRKAHSLLLYTWEFLQDRGEADTRTATEFIQALSEAHAQVAVAIPEILVARRNERRSLTPDVAEVSPALLRHLHERATAQGPNWRLGVMLYRPLTLPRLPPFSLPRNPSRYTRRWLKGQARKSRLYN